MYCNPLEILDEFRQGERRYMRATEYEGPELKYTHPSFRSEYIDGFWPYVISGLPTCRDTKQNKSKLIRLRNKNSRKKRTR